MANIPTPVTRREQYLSAIAGEDHGVPESPITREEQYLQAILDNGGGGGGGGTTNYNALSNKPQIGGVTLSGNKSAADLGLATATALDGKVDKVNGKGLSTNDYTDADKAIVDGVGTALDSKVDKVTGKGLSTNDYTTADQTKLTGLVDIQSIGTGLNLNTSTGELTATGAAITIDTEMSDSSVNPVQNKVITEALGGKVDAVSGKGLSENDYTNTDKAIVGGVTSALADKVDKVSGKGLSTNDYDATAKTKLDGLSNIQSIGTGLNLNTSTGELTATGAAITIDTEMSESSVNPVQNKVITAALGGKQDSLTFDNAPTENSNNPVKSGGIYTALAGKVDTNGTDRLMTAAEGTKLSGIETGAEVNVQADWSQTDNAEDDYIKNKPTLGTAAAKDSTNAVTANSTDLVESGAVKTAIDNAVASAYHHAGTKTVAQLTSSLLVAANEGDVYNITDSGTTTADFIEGAGWPIRAGDNVGVAKVGEGSFKFDLLSGFIDTSNFVTKSQTAGLIKNDGTIDTNTYALQSEMSVTDGTGGDADKTTIQLKSGTSATVLKSHQSLTDYVQKSQTAGLLKNDGTVDTSKYAPMSFVKAVGAYNLLDNTWSTSVISSVTVTKVADGTLTTSGTSSAADDQEIGVATLKAGTYKLTGCPADGGSAAYRLKAVNKASGNTVIGYDDGEGLSITLAADATVGINLVFASSVPMTGLTFKPMITPDTGATYADYIPHAMTNKELTEKKAGITVTTTDPGEGTALSDNTLLVVVEGE